MHDHPRGLVDDEKVVVFVADGELGGFWLGPEACGRRGQPRIDGLALEHARRGAWRDAAGDRHVAGCHGALDDGSRDPGVGRQATKDDEVDAVVVVAAVGGEAVEDGRAGVVGHVMYELCRSHV
jgi:hypothetical protein